MTIKVTDKSVSKEDVAHHLILLQYQANPHIKDTESHQMSGRILRTRKQKSKKDAKKVKAKEQCYER